MSPFNEDGELSFCKWIWDKCPADIQTSLSFRLATLALKLLLCCAGQNLFLVALLFWHPKETITVSVFVVSFIQYFSSERSIIMASLSLGNKCQVTLNSCCVFYIAGPPNQFCWPICVRGLGWYVWVFLSVSTCMSKCLFSQSWLSVIVIDSSGDMRFLSGKS